MSTMVRAQSVGVRFLFDRQRRVVAPTLARLHRRGSEVWGLREVTFAIEPGEGVALIGRSGSGKTTLLRTVAGIFVPDAGHLEVRGRVATLLSTEAGLMPSLTGRENALLLGVLAGLSRRRSKDSLQDVKDGSGLGEQFERPTSSFSQGMRARLGFAVAERVDPDILLLDEVHEALDHEFREAVEFRARATLERGGIVLAAGHDHAMLARICDRAFLMDQGHIRAEGDFSQTVRLYLGELDDAARDEPPDHVGKPASPTRNEESVRNSTYGRANFTHR